MDLVVVVYASERLRTTARAVAQIHAVQRIDRLVVVVNRGSIDPAALRAAGLFRHGRLSILEHDNTGHEFGGYQAGIDLIGDDLAEQVVVMNDTVGSHQIIGPPFFAAMARMIQDGTYPKFVTGTIFHMPRQAVIDGLTTSRVLRSNLMAFDRAALAAIDRQIYLPRLDALIRPVAEAEAFFDPRINDVLREHMTEWLFATGGRHWYKARPLTAESAAFLAQKARCQVQEHHLSMRLNAADVAFLSPVLTKRERYAHRLERLRFRVKARIMKARDPDWVSPLS